MGRRIFFSGQYHGENGPAEVNKNIVAFLPNNVARLRSRNRYLMRLEILCKICWCDVLILSAIGHKQYEIKLARLLKRKIIYIMHGFAEDDSPFLHSMETRLLPHTDKILCVSSPFYRLAKKRFPPYADKMEVINPRNGKIWSVKHFFAKPADGGILYNGYTQINQLLLSDNHIKMETVKTLPDILPPTNIPLFDKRREKTWREELNGYLSEDAPYTGEALDYDRLWKFISVVARKFVIEEL